MTKTTRQTWGGNDGNLHIVWYYPEIYDREKQPSITIDLFHTRAAQNLTIKYDSERDGWVFYMEKVIAKTDEPGDCDLWTAEIIEVGFVSGWAGRDSAAGRPSLNQ